MSEPCPHCKTTAKHGERIGCCSGCGVLFASMSAFDKHRKGLECRSPLLVGLIAKTPKTDPTATMWGLAGSWDRADS